MNPCTLCQLSKHFPAAEIVEAGRNAAIDSEQLLRHILGAKFDYVRLEPGAVAELLVRSAAGNELYGATPPTPTVFRRRLDALALVFVVGLGGQISR